MAAGYESRAVYLEEVMSLLSQRLVYIYKAVINHTRFTQDAARYEIDTTYSCYPVIAWMSVNPFYLQKKQTVNNKQNKQVYRNRIIESRVAK